MHMTLQVLNTFLKNLAPINSSQPAGKDKINYQLVT
jgi:hypothetical protein